MSNRFKDNKILSFIITFLGMAVAFIAFYVFFDWFYCISVKKEAFYMSMGNSWSEIPGGEQGWAF